MDMDDHRVARKQSSVWVSIISVLLIVGSVATALTVLQRFPMAGANFSGSGALNGAVTLDMNSVALLTQPQGAWFSPDGSRLATIGLYTPCPMTSQQLPTCDHVLAIIDTHTKELEHISPIEVPLNMGATPSNDEYLSLYGIGWSPDSTWFGIIYNIFDTATPQSLNDLIDSGLLLENPSTGGASVIRGDAGYFAGQGDLTPDHPIWNIPQRNEAMAAPLAPAMTYTWDSTSAPTPLDLATNPLAKLPPDADSFSPIGNPDGHAPFTIWQPGLLVGPGSSSLPGQRSAFITTFSAWSNNDQRIGVFTSGVSLPTPNAALSMGVAHANVGAPHFPQPDNFVTAPARDPAMTNVQDLIGAYGWALIAWNPSGSALASVSCFNRLGESVQLRDTIAGELIGQQTLATNASDPGCRDLKQASKPGAYPHLNQAFAWSPDGSQLVLVDTSASSITIWQNLNGH